MEGVSVITITPAERVDSATAVEPIVSVSSGKSVIAVVAVEEVAALLARQSVIARAAAERAARATEIELVFARTAGRVDGHSGQTRRVEHVVALAHINDDVRDAGVSLIPVVVLDVDRAIVAVEEELFVAVFGVEVPTIGRARTGVDVERRAFLSRQIRLHARRVVLELEESQSEQLEIE